MPNKHLTVGGSTIARTIACPAWLHLSKDVPKDKGANEFADKGTLLHNCLEEYFTHGSDTTFMQMVGNGNNYNGIVLDRDMVTEILEPSRKAAEEVMSNFGIDNYMLEPFVELVEGYAGGSIDFLGWSSDGKTVLVLDWKTGFNPVNVEENKQLLFYGLCASVDPETSHIFAKAEQVVFAIIQPNDQGEVADVWVQPVKTLDQFESEVYDAIDTVDLVTENNSVDMTSAGDHCQYCPAQPTCPTKTGVAQAALRINPKDIERLNTNMQMVDELEKWCKAVKKVAHEQMELGINLADFKLVGKRASRVWVDEETVQKKIRNSHKLTVAETHETPKLFSPAKLEKVLKAKGLDKDKFEAYYESVSSGTTVARRDDKRPEVTIMPSELALKALRDSL